MGFSDYETALKARDVHVSIVESVLNRLRPEPRQGEVYDFDVIAMTCDVLLPGDTTPLKVKMGRHQVPYHKKMDAPDGSAPGDVVRFAGRNGNYYLLSIYGLPIPSVVTSTTRPPLTGLPNGFSIFETDTGRSYKTVSGAWVLTSSPGNPVGTISMWGGATPPTNYLICNGSTFSSVTYPDLATALGDTYGTHSGTNYFLPDFRGRSPVGVGAAVPADGSGYTFSLGQKFGESMHTLSITEMPSHAHNQLVQNGGLAAGPPYSNGNTFVGWTNSAGVSGTNTNVAGGGGAHNIFQPVTAINYIIKALPDGVVYSGAGGSTAGDSGWIDAPVVAPYSYYDQASFACRYRKLNGVVFVQGLAKWTGSAFGPVFTLPVGYRPSQNLIFSTMAASNLIATMYVYNTGVVFHAAGGSTAWNSMDGISFPADI